MLGRDNKIEIIGSRGEFEEAIDENGSHNWPGSSFPRHPFEFYHTTGNTRNKRRRVPIQPASLIKNFFEFHSRIRTQRIENYLLISFFLERKKRKKKK